MCDTLFNLNSPVKCSLLKLIIKVRYIVSISISWGYMFILGMKKKGLQKNSTGTGFQIVCFYIIFFYFHISISKRKSVPCVVLNVLGLKF